VIAVLLDATARLPLQLAWATLIYVIMLLPHVMTPHRCHLREATFDRLDRLTQFIRRRP
jgi:hypothetical protein